MDAYVEKQLQTLNHLHKEAGHIYGSLATQFGLTNTELWILYAISHANHAITQNDLCNALFLPRQTVNSAIRKLVNKRLVELKVIPKTKNKKEILFTPKGSTFLLQTIYKMDEAEKNAFLLFSAEERAQYISLLQRHIENLKNEEQRVLSSNAAPPENF